jgi:hypothetical protein
MAEMTSDAVREAIKQFIYIQSAHGTAYFDQYVLYYLLLISTQPQSADSKPNKAREH